MDSMCNNKTYYKFLLQILNNQDNIDYEDNLSLLKINIYLSLLSLNNNNYKDSIYENEYEIINNFLRKINNLKVKIQLKRKNNEIDKLSNDIISLYKDNIKIIKKYNKNNFQIEEIINGKDIKNITKLLDSMTKIKIEKNVNLSLCKSRGIPGSVDLQEKSEQKDETLDQGRSTRDLRERPPGETQ